MMNDPIVVWPPGTFHEACVAGDNINCSDLADHTAQTAFVCCPAW